MRKRSPETALKIVRAALALVIENGFKATTMEGIAARAGISKGTLYAYFPDKDAIFSALMADLADRMSEAFAAAFVGDDGIATRVGRGLAAQYGVVADLLEGSEFTQELIGEHSRFASGVKAADIAIGEIIVAELEAAGISDAHAIVPLLKAACTGILAQYPSAREVRAAIMLLCERMVR